MLGPLTVVEIGRGYIPACAGETIKYLWTCGGNVALDCVSLGGTVHPRVCGGNGPRVGVADSLVEEGYIPACAGETRLHAILDESLRVHPRVCGGNTAPNLPCPPSGVQVHPRVCGGNGTAGILSYGAFLYDGVHPRVCGGNM